MKTKTAVSSFWDRAGIALSGLCLVHCLALPLLAALLPVAGLGVCLHEGFHQGLAVVLIFTSAFAFVPGFLLHRKHIVFFWMVPGLAIFIFTSYFLHRLGGCALELPLNLFAGACLIRAHWLNRTFCRSCRECGDECTGI